MIEYTPKNFFFAHWFVDQPPKDWRILMGLPNMNWMAAAWRRPDGLIEAKYRFAYYDDREVRIRSSWQEFHMKSYTPREIIIEGLDKIAIQIASNNNSKWERVDLNLPGDEAIELLLDKPWMQIKAVGSLN